jgi:hypothetical protein
MHSKVAGQTGTLHRKYMVLPRSSSEPTGDDLAGFLNGRNNSWRFVHLPILMGSCGSIQLRHPLMNMKAIIGLLHVAADRAGALRELKGRGHSMSALHPRSRHLAKGCGVSYGATTGHRPTDA